MRRVQREREVELDEARVTLVVLVLLALVGSALYLGMRVGIERGAVAAPVAAGLSQAPTVAAVGGERRPPRSLPRNFIGPPVQPNPPVVGAGPGAGASAVGPSFAVDLRGYDDLVSARDTRLRLLASGYPAYLVSRTGRHLLRVGDYATQAEARAVRDELAALENWRGSVSQVP